MSVRDRIANLNSSKAPIMTTVGSGAANDSSQPGKLNRVYGNPSSNSNNSSATNSGEGTAANEQQVPKSSIADRIAKLKQAQPSESTDQAPSPAGDVKPKSVGSISSKIALLGANVRLGERPPGAMYSNPSSHHTSAVGSRENTASSCASDNHSDSGVISKNNNSGDSTSLVHLTMERPSKPGGRSRAKTSPLRLSETS